MVCYCSSHILWGMPATTIRRTVGSSFPNSVSCGFDYKQRRFGLLTPDLAELGLFGERSPARGNIFRWPACLPKMSLDSSLREARSSGVRKIPITAAGVDPFRPGRTMILRG